MKLKDKILVGLPAVSLYLLLNFAHFVKSPYLNLVPRSAGLSMEEITLVVGLVPFISFPATPMFGYLADKVGYKLVLLIQMFIGAGISLAYGVLPQYREVTVYKIGVKSIDAIVNMTDDSAIVQFGEYFSNGECRNWILDFTITDIHCNNNIYNINKKIYIDQMKNVTYQYCDARKTDYCLYEVSEVENTTVYCDAFLEGSESVHKSGNKQAILWLFVLIRILYGYLHTSMWNTADAIASRTARILKVDWAVISFFGNISMVIAPLTIGLLLHKYDGADKLADCISGVDLGVTDYTLPFFVNTGILLATSLLFLFIKIEADTEEKSKRSWKEDFKWMASPAPIAFYCLAVFMGIINGVRDAFYSVFLTEELNVNQKWFGLANSVSGATALLSFLVGGLLDKYTGSMNTMLLGLLVHSLRITILGYNRVYDHDETPVEILLNSALDQEFLYVGIVGYAAIISPKNLTATGLGLASTSTWVIGTGLGAILAGQVNKIVGTRTMLAIFGFTGIGVSLFYGVIYHLFIKKTEAKAEEEETGTSMEMSDAKGDK